MAAARLQDKLSKPELPVERRIYPATPDQVRIGDGVVLDAHDDFWWAGRVTELTSEVVVLKLAVSGPFGRPEMWVGKGASAIVPWITIYRISVDR